MIHYLTVQDVLWINHEVSKRVNTFKYAQLEEATFYQYGYGKSEDIIGQAGQFLEGFIKLRPFSSANRATALVSVLTFLQINGCQINLAPGEAAEWALRVARKEQKGIDAIRSAVAEGRGPVALKPVVRTEVHDIMEKYAADIAALED